jgi:protein associated with RNAse G/E
MPLTQPDQVIVIKQNPQREETWRYSGKVLERTEDSILIEAFFNRPDKPFHGVLLAEGDRFIERYYTNRWYNIYEIHDHKTDALKAWYCNVTYPTIFEDGVIIYIDLALDLLVYSDGRHLVLDEDEFLELNLGQEDEKKAREALKELQEIFDPPVKLRLG